MTEQLIADIKEYLEDEQPDFLEEAKVINREPSYVCPHCDNGSGKNRTGIVYNKKSSRWHCFSCDRDMDIFDLAMASNGIESFPEAVKWVADYYGVYFVDDDTFAFRPRPPKKLKVKPYEGETDYTDYFNKVSLTSNYHYLLMRGISIETQKKFGIGYDEHWRHPKVNDNIPATPRCIIPTSPYSYLARDTRPERLLDEKEKRYVKQKVGQTHIFNLEVMTQVKEYVFIAEGEIDALSIIDCGYPAIGLGSVANADRLLEMWNQNRWYMQTVFIFADADNRGITTAEKLKKELESRGLCKRAQIVDFPFNTNFKDPNEFLIADRDWFTIFLRNVVENGCNKTAVLIDEREYEHLCQIASNTQMTLSDCLSGIINGVYQKAIVKSKEGMEMQYVKMFE